MCEQRNLLMAKEKKTENLTLRVESRLMERLMALEEGLGYGRAEIVRQALYAVISHYEKNGRLDFPIEIAEKKGVGAELLKEAVSEEASRIIQENSPQLIEEIKSQVMKHYQMQLAAIGHRFEKLSQDNPGDPFFQAVSDALNNIDSPNELAPDETH